MQFDLKTFPLREEVLEMTKAHWKPEAKKEYVPLEQALGRVTAEELFSLNTLPVCRASACDGYAVRSKDFEGGIPDTTGWKKGDQYESADMGDDFPDEYDTVIAVESVRFDDQGSFHLAEGFEFVKGALVREEGSTIRKGDRMLAAHTRITPEHLALLATGGVRMVPVLRKPRVAFIPTGSELIPAGSIPGRGQTVECNGIMLSSIINGWGAECISFPIVRDDKQQLEQILDEALAGCDIVVINGGSSKGGEDFNARLLERRGEFFSYGVRSAPGRPVGVAIIDGKPVVNVPGPVLAAWLAVDWMVRGLVHFYYGTPETKRQIVKARLEEPLKKPPFMELRMRVSLTAGPTGYRAKPVPREMGMTAMACMDGLITAPVGSTGFAAGDLVDVELLIGEELIPGNMEEL